MNDNTKLQEFTTEHAQQYEKNFSEDSFWSKLKKEAAKAGGAVVYVALQLYYVLASKRVPFRDKGLILGALGYLILPVDLIPDLIPLIGYSDDLTALIAAYKLVKSNIDDEIRDKARSKTNELLGKVEDKAFTTIDGIEA